MKRKLKISDNWILIAIVLIHTVLLYQLVDFSKALETYQDELIYYNIAKCIADGKLFSVHGMEMNFTNIAYSLVLVPFCYIENTLVRIKAICFFNSFLISLSLIPVWLICKELNVQKKITWFIIGVVSIYPGMLTAATFMAENLYWPLTLITYYYVIKTIKNKKICDTCICALLIYLCYFCKEVGLSIMLGMIAFMILSPIESYIFDKHREKNLLKYYIKNFYVKNFICFMTIFFVLYFFMKNVVFATMYNSYGGAFAASASVTSSNDFAYRFMLYAFIYYIVYSVIAFYIIPVLYPLSLVKDMEEHVRKTYFFFGILFLGTIITIIYTISIREDLGNTLIRVHMRYFASLIGVILPIYGASIPLKLEKKKRNLVWAILLIFTIASFFTFKGGVIGSAPESLELYYYCYLHKILGTRMIGNYEVYLSGFICSIIFLGIVILGYLLHRKKQYLFHVMIFILAIIINVLNINKDLELLKCYYVPESYISDMQKINAYFENNKLEDSSVMFVCDKWYTKNPKVYDTYFIGKEVYEISYNSLMDKVDSNLNGIDIDECIFNEAVTNREFQTDKIDFFIVSTEVGDFSGMIGDIEYIEEASSPTYELYKNIDSERICVNEIPTANIIFSAGGYNATDCIMTGISNPEESFSWTDGNKFAFKYPNLDSNGLYTIRINCVTTYNGNQSFIIRQNENEISVGEICGNSQIKFDLEVVDNQCEFTIDLPDALSPYENGESADTRNLALAISSITISKTVK